MPGYLIAYAFLIPYTLIISFIFTYLSLNKCPGGSEASALIGVLNTDFKRLVFSAK